MVPNPYTLLSLLPPSHQVYTVLDLKDAFFSLPLAEVSQPIFAFEWIDQGGIFWPINLDKTATRVQELHYPV
jgi:hypothetical protein